MAKMKVSTKSISKSKFKTALTTRQVGAKRIGKNKYSLGGGVFTKKEIIKSRLRFGKTRGMKGIRL